jgi:transcriptional regulator with XRE-family HTH domain
LTPVTSDNVLYVASETPLCWRDGGIFPRGVERGGMEPLARLIRDKRAGRTLREVAEETGVSAPTLLRIERGRAPDLATFARLCRWLEIPADALLPGEPAATDGRPTWAQLLAENYTLRSMLNRLLDESQEISEQAHVLVGALREGGG